MSKDKKHPSHTTRSSDASSFDEICTKCGAKDISGGGWGDLAKPCSVNVKSHSVSVSKFRLRTNKQLANMLVVRANRLRGMKGPNVLTDFNLLMEVANRLKEK